MYETAEERAKSLRAGVPDALTREKIFARTNGYKRASDSNILKEECKCI
ncbi:Uncharacterised protein [uncultured archaeon]|nr:Uncharacterised protein [uncultured archaeon]